MGYPLTRAELLADSRRVQDEAHNSAVATFKSDHWFAKSERQTAREELGLKPGEELTETMFLNAMNWIYDGHYGEDK